MLFINNIKLIMIFLLVIVLICMSNSSNSMNNLEGLETNLNENDNNNDNENLNYQDNYDNNIIENLEDNKNDQIDEELDGNPQEPELDLASTPNMNSVDAKSNSDIMAYDSLDQYGDVNFSNTSTTAKNMEILRLENEKKKIKNKF